MIQFDTILLYQFCELVNVHQDNSPINVYSNRWPIGNVFCQAAEPSQGYMQEPHRKVNISEQIFKHNNTKAGAIF